MPQLNTTINDIELKSNKKTSVDISSAASWTDDTYPSAKALYDLVHPIGSIYITSNKDEKPSEKFGGTWVLVDKAFKGSFITFNPSSDWTATNATLHNTSNALLIDHMIHLRIYVNTTAVINNDADVVLGKLKLSTCGISTTLSTAVYRQPAISEIGNCTVNYTLDNDGTITIHDILSINGDHQAPVGSDILFNVVFPVGYDRMLDNFCGTFYWKRTE